MIFNIPFMARCNEYAYNGAVCCDFDQLATNYRECKKRIMDEITANPKGDILKKLAYYLHSREVKMTNWLFQLKQDHRCTVKKRMNEMVVLKKLQS